MGFFFDIVTQATHGRNLDTSDEALDAAADFQDGFREYLPLYNEYTGSSLTLENDIQKPYDELREIDFRRLSEVAEKGAQIADDVQETRDEINTKVGEVTGWSGDAANAFLAHIQRFQTATQTIDTELGDIATATGDAVPATQNVIAEYVNAIGDIDFSDFDSTDTIQLLMKIERMALSVGDLIRKLYDFVGDLIGIALPSLPTGGGGGLIPGLPDPGDLVEAATDFVLDIGGRLIDFVLDAIGMAADEFLEWVAGKVREYLNNSFKEPFENNFELLNNAVQTAKQGVIESFQPMVDAANRVKPDAFAQLGTPPEDNPNRPAQPPPGHDDHGGRPTQPGEPAQPSQPSQPAVSPGSDPGGPGPGGPVPSTSPPPVLTPPAGTPPVETPPVGTPPVGTPPVGGGELPQPQPESVPVPPSPGDGVGERPSGLPPAAGWIADPSQLPNGWTIDPETGELLPPGAPGGEGDPEVHSPEGRDVLDGDDSDDGTTPDPDTPSEITRQLGDMTITISGGGASGEGISLKLTDADGDSAQYQIRIDENGNPELVPAETSSVRSEPPIMTMAPTGLVEPVGMPTVTPEPTTAPLGAQPTAAGTPFFAAAEAPATAPTPAGVPLSTAASLGSPPAAGLAPAPGVSPASTVPAAEGFGSGDQPAGGGPSFAAGQVSGGPSFATGAVTPGGPSLPSGPADGSYATGSVSTGSGHAAVGSAQLASASEAGATGGPGGAQLASAADESRPGQQGSGGAPYLPMGGAMGGGGDEDRRGSGSWQVPGTVVFEPEEEARARVSGVLGDES